MERMIEVCCGSYDDALASERGGASRIELNSALYLGGLTPSLASLILTKKNTNLKVITMVRPRGAGFCYTDEEFETMLCDTRLMMENGADGIAFGCLTKDGEIDVEQTKQIIDIIQEYNGEVVFHRAFDCVKNADEAMEILISLHVDRVLTSGLKAKAMDGIDMIAHLQEKYGDKIQILAGSGMNASNALEMMEKTGISQVHSSCKSWRNDPITSGEDVNYCYAAAPHENDYDVVSEELVRKIVNSVC